MSLHQVIVDPKTILPRVGCFSIWSIVDSGLLGSLTSGTSAAELLLLDAARILFGNIAHSPRLRRFEYCSSSSGK